MQAQLKQTIPCPKCSRITSLYSVRCEGCGQRLNGYTSTSGHDERQTELRQPVLRQAAVKELDVPTPGGIQKPVGTHLPVIAAVASFLLPGLGQIYNRQYWKGSLLNFGYTVLFWPSVLYFYGIPALVAALAVAVDAAIIASKLNRGKVVLPWETF